LQITAGMNRNPLNRLLLVFLAGALGNGAACADAQVSARSVHEESATLRPAEVVSAGRPPLTEEERQFYRDAAALAWRFMVDNYQPSTGFVNATPDWSYTTVWDVGGQLLATVAARDIGIITDAELHDRMRRALRTLERVQLVRGAAYNKVYSTVDGSAGDGRKGATGWSATDLGRLLVALHVISVREPAYAEQSRRIVGRIDMRQVVRDGYMHGQLMGSSGQPWTFQEGRIGYEQYVAAGFAHWGAQVDAAADLTRHGRSVEVYGIELLADTRSLDRLLSEPFLMMGLELGLDGDLRVLAGNLLAAQEARYRSTGRITIASEDAVSVAPHYFYYYCVYCSGKPFVVETSSPGVALEAPRWVSTKGAFGWHALMPGDYTRKALDHVAAARSGRGWASGVYEEDGRSTATYNINTAALILEAAAYQLRGGKPIIRP
jgi:hypothetical protein